MILAGTVCILGKCYNITNSSRIQYNTLGTQYNTSNITKRSTDCTHGAIVQHTSIVQYILNQTKD